MTDDLFRGLEDAKEIDSLLSKRNALVPPLLAPPNAYSHLESVESPLQNKYPKIDDGIKELDHHYIGTNKESCNWPEMEYIQGHTVH